MPGAYVANPFNVVPTLGCVSIEPGDPAPAMSDCTAIDAFDFGDLVNSFGGVIENGLSCCLQVSRFESPLDPADTCTSR